MNTLREQALPFPLTSKSELKPHVCHTSTGHRAAQHSRAEQSTLLSGHAAFWPLGAGEESSHCCPRASPRLGAIKLYKTPDGF